MTNETEVISLDELQRIESEFEQDKPKTQEQIKQESNAIMEQAIQESKRQLNDGIRDVQAIYLMGAMLIILIGVIKVMIIRWIKKQSKTKDKKLKLRKIK